MGFKHFLKTRQGQLFIGIILLGLVIKLAESGYSFGKWLFNFLNG